MYYSFSLTSLKGDKSYVTCITTYEPFGDVARAQEKYREYLFGPQPVVPVCYCLMSRVVCTEFSRAWLLKYISAGAEREKMVERVLARKHRKQKHLIHIYQHSFSSFNHPSIHSHFRFSHQQTGRRTGLLKGARPCQRSPGPTPWTSTLSRYLSAPFFPFHLHDQQITTIILIIEHTHSFLHSLIGDK